MIRCLFRETLINGKSLYLYIIMKTDKKKTNSNLTLKVQYPTDKLLNYVRDLRNKKIAKKKELVCNS